MYSPTKVPPNENKFFVDEITSEKSDDDNDSNESSDDSEDYHS